MVLYSTACGPESAELQTHAGNGAILKFTFIKEAPLLYNNLCFSLSFCKNTFRIFFSYKMYCINKMYPVIV